MDDYAYINARVRAMRAGLLDPRVYEDMLGLQDISGMCECLGRTVYGKGLGEARIDVSIAVLEDWLRGEWARAVQKVHRITDGQPREFLEILLGRWEVENIKAILRGKRADRGITEIMATMLPTGLFDETSLAELARQPSIQAVVDLLVTWRSPYAKPLREALRSHRELKGLEPLELALDHYYFEGALRRLEGWDQNARSVRQLLGLLIDRANLLMAFKIARQGVASRSDIPNYFIKGGTHFPVSIYETLVRAQGMREIAETFRKTPYAEIAEGLEREQGGIPPSVRLERGLDQFVLDRAKAMGSTDPLGIGMMIGYLLQKYYEVCNIRVILRARAYGLYPEDIRSLLVM
jgi:V/A-type H+-transporting ATPase subunit C